MRRATGARLWRVLFATCLLLLVALNRAAGRSDEAPAEVRAPIVLVATIDSIIHPVAAEHLLEVLAQADQEGADLVVLQLSTPGGLLTSTRQMASAMLEAQTPVVVYVAPQGAQAASAGFFLLMAADVAAMAPSTNSGAAHPVGGQGEDIEGAMGEKVEADSAAWIRSLAERNGRDLELAESAVLESRSFAAQEALDLGLIDVVAASLDELLVALDERVLQRDDGAVTLRTRGATIRPMEQTTFQKVRGALVNPNIAYLLLSLGGLGLWVEITNPGAIFPGVLGAIAFILGLYATSALPVNTAGIAFLILAGVLFFAEVKTGGFGILGTGGIVSLVLGGLMLFQTPDPALRVSYQVIVAIALTSVAVVAPLSVLVWRARRNRVRTGEEGLVGALAEARGDFVARASALAGEPNHFRGKVDLHGEIWNAESGSPVAAGDLLEVIRVDGLTVRVAPQGERLAGA